MIELYHFASALCGAKVRLVLEEKGLAWVSRPVTDLRDETYLTLNPRGVVPTLIHDGRTLFESRVISEYLEESFPQPSLTPSTPFERYQMRYWSKQIDDGLHLALYILGFSASGFGGPAMDDPAVQAKRLPRDDFKRAVALDLLADRWTSRWQALALTRARSVVADLEARLSDAAWLAGSHYSLADADFTPCLARLQDLGLEDLWSTAPAVARWWERLQERPSYEAALTRWRGPADETRFAEGRQALAMLARRHP